MRRKDYSDGAGNVYLFKKVRKKFYSNIIIYKIDK